MAENRDDQARYDAIAGQFNPETARKVGFRDGFIGKGARSISEGFEPQTAYFEGFQEGREHRSQVDRVAAQEGIEIDDLMRKAFGFYYQAHYGPKP